jgi:hypothetical protein
MNEIIYLRRAYQIALLGTERAVHINMGFASQAGDSKRFRIADVSEFVMLQIDGHVCVSIF